MGYLTILQSFWKEKNILFKEEVTFENSFNLISNMMIEGKLVRGRVLKRRIYKVTSRKNIYSGILFFAAEYSKEEI